MAYKNDDWWIKKAFDDEKLFVLMARDITSPIVVMEWVKLNLLLQPRDRLIEALDCAIEMSKTRDDINIKKFKEQFSKPDIATP